MKNSTRTPSTKLAAHSLEKVYILIKQETTNAHAHIHLKQNTRTAELAPCE